MHFSDESKINSVTYKCGGTNWDANSCPTYSGEVGGRNLRRTAAMCSGLVAAFFHSLQVDSMLETHWLSADGFNFVAVTKAVLHIWK